MLRKITLLLCIVFTQFIYCAQLPFELKALTQADTKESVLQESHLSDIAKINGEDAVDIIITGNFDLNLLPEDCQRVFRWSSLTTVRIKINELTTLQNIPDIEKIYPSLKSELLLDISTSDHVNGNYYAGCDADYIQEYLDNGEDVFIGLIDPYPLNWQHEDFQNEDGSRIASVWDQNTEGIPPLGFSYGSEFTQDDLNSNIGPGINSGLHHGTQCAGIAAGNGNASNGDKAGMAPQASIFYVEYTGNSADLIDAIAYISMKASEIDPEKPLVLSLSVGAMFSHPDGSDPVAQALQNFGGIGRVSAVAAGNWYNYDCFATGSAQFGNPVNDFSFTISGSNTGGNDFVISRLYYIAGDDFSVTVTDPGLNQLPSVMPGIDNTFTTDFGELYIYHDSTELGTPYMEIVVSDENGIMTAGDTWQIELSIPSESLDDNGGWWWGWIAGVGYGAEFDNYYQGAYSLNVYACAENSICAAAHDKNSGNIYSACSKGAPDSIIKPEISCPTNANSTNAASSTGYSNLCCTSGAAPHAAGAMALILSKFPELNASDVIQILTDTAWQDGQTGNIPNDRWGYGKLNAKEAYLLHPLFGDIDNSKEIDAFDSSIILMLTVGFNYFEETDPIPWQEWRQIRADVDGNQEIEAYDAGLILQYIVQLISEFPAAQ